MVTKKHIYRRVTDVTSVTSVTNNVTNLNFEVRIDRDMLVENFTDWYTKGTLHLHLTGQNLRD